MADQVDRFYADWHDKLVPSRGGIKGQCVSLVQKYLEDQFGASGTPVFPVAYAKDMFGVRNDLGTWVRNNPSNSAPRGSIVVFNGNMGGGAGHVGIEVAGNNPNNVHLFQQNDPYGSGATVKDYSYNNVIGWLIPNGLNQPAPQGEVKMFTNPVNGDTRDAQGWYAAYAERDVQAHQFIDQLTAANNHVGDLQTQVNNLTKAVQDSQALIGKLQKQLEDSGVDKASLTKQIEALNKKVGDVTTSQVGLDKIPAGDLFAALLSKLVNVFKGNK